MAGNNTMSILEAWRLMNVKVFEISTSSWLNLHTVLVYLL